MSATNRRTKTIAGETYRGVYKRDKFVLADAVEVTPGMALEILGEADESGYYEVGPMSDDAGGKPLLLAAERSHPPTGDDSRTLRKDIDYTEPGEVVEAFAPVSGDATDNALLALGETVDVGEDVVYNDDGTFRAFDALADDTAGSVVGTALEEITDDTAISRFEVQF